MKDPVLTREDNYRTGDVIFRIVIPPDYIIDHPKKSITMAEILVELVGKFAGWIEENDKP